MCSALCLGLGLLQADSSCSVFVCSVRSQTAERVGIMLRPASMSRAHGAQVVVCLASRLTEIVVHSNRETNATRQGRRSTKVLVKAVAVIGLTACEIRHRRSSCSGKKRNFRCDDAVVSRSNDVTHPHLSLRTRQHPSPPSQKRLTGRHVIISNATIMP